jgi:hypothetical protein
MVVVEVVTAAATQGQVLFSGHYRTFLCPPRRT